MNNESPLYTGVGSVVSGFNRAAGVASSAFSYFRSSAKAPATQSPTTVNSQVPLPRRKPSKEPTPPAGQPLRLRLEFSKAADLKRVQAMFDPAVKSVIDRNNYVAVRETEVLKEALTKGGGAFLTGPGTEIFNMAMSYEIRKPTTRETDAPDYIEMGSTMSRSGGYNAAQLTLAALTLKQWWNNPPEEMFVTEIIPGNSASIRTYAAALGWRAITSRPLMKDLFFLCNQTISGGDKNKETLWFHCDDSVITHQARILLSFMDQGGLVNRQSRSRIAVDFSALDDVGLNRKRLEAIAVGTTNRTKLQTIGPK